jgi:type I restriction enzyme, S subunit
MSRVEDLAAGLCPNGVRFLPIGDASVSAQLVAGATPRSGIPEYWTNGTIPWMSSGEVNRGTVTTTDKLITQAAYDATSTRTVPEGSVVVALAGQGKTRGMVARTRIPLCTNQSLAAIVPGEAMDADFLYYYLQTQYRKLREVSSGDGTRGGLNLQMIRAYRVPVPPMALQREIVDILDTFAELEAELVAELAARRRQYDLIADELLRSGNDVPRRRLGGVASIVRGASPRPIQAFISRENDGIPWIKIGDVPAGGKYITQTAQRITPAGAVKSRRVHPGDFVLSNSMSFGRPYISKIEGCIHDGWLAISGFDTYFVPDYLYYLLRSRPIQAEFARRAGAGTVQNLNADIVKSVLVPVPSRSQQEEAVALLDKFDALVNDISAGLPAELAARRKQYEYYRTNLLTFEELKP